MDFRQISQPGGSRPQAESSAVSTSEHKEKATKHARTSNLMQVFNGLMLIGIALLIAVVAIAISRTGKDSTELKYVSSSKYQAVFLSNGQVYFGHVTALNNNYLRMSDIYYLTQSSDTASSNYNLVKLGCQQIHDPYDAMVINRSQVTFWENIQDDGKVVTSIKQFKQQNPNGPDCSQVSNQTQASGGTTTQGGSSSSSSSSNK